MTTISWRIPKSLFMSFSPFSLSGNFFETRSLWKSLKSSHLSDHCSSDTNLVFQVITWNLWWIQIQQVLLVTYLVYLPFFNFSNRRVCYCSTSILHISSKKINTILSGAATIRLEMPSHMQNSLIFHYNLKFYGDDTDNYDGISLKRFVMQVNSINMRAINVFFV